MLRKIVHHNRSRAQGTGTDPSFPLRSDGALITKIDTDDLHISYMQSDLLRWNPRGIDYN